MKGVFRTEVDNAVVEVENLVREKGIVYRDEIDRLCKHLDKKSRKQVFFLLGRKRHLRRVEDMFQYDEKEGKTEVEESEIFSSLMKPEFVNTERDCVQVGNTFFRGLCCTGFPAEVDNNWLSRLASEKGNADFGIFITPSSIAASEIYLNAELKRVNFDLYRYQEQNIPNPSLEERKRELEQSLRALVSGEYKHFKVALFLIAKGASREKAAGLSKKISSSLSGDGIESEYATFYQEPLFKSIVPLGVNHLRGRENIVPGDGLAASFPFSFPWLDIDEEDGILLGWNDNGLPIARSMWKEPSYSGVFVGPTGSGKSYAAKTFIHLENMIRGTRIIIVDPAATKGAAPEYKRMCREKNGSYISFSTKSKNIPNILSLYGDSYEDAMFDVESLLSVLLGGENGTVSDAQKPVLEKALVRTYEKAGVTEDVKTWENPPTLDMLYSTLQQDMRSVRSEQTRMSYEALINRLSRFVGRGLYKFINQRKSELNVDNPFTVFEFKDTPNEIKPVLTGIVMNYIKEKALGNTDKTLIVLEEAHLWLSNPVLAEFIGKLVVLLRKSNTGIILIFQGVSQLQNCEQGVTVLGNLMFTYILGCKKAEMPLTAKAFGLNDIEQELILNSKQGSGVLIWNKKHFTVNIRINKEIHRLVTTHPEEVKAIEVEETQKTPVDDESMESLKEDLGYAPQTLEEGAKAMAKDIARGNTDEGIINHYHEPCASLVRKHLADFRRKGVVPADKLTKAQDEELEKLAKRIEQRLISKASKKKKGERKRKKQVLKKKARRS